MRVFFGAIIGADYRLDFAEAVNHLLVPSLDFLHGTMVVVNV